LFQRGRALFAPNTANCRIARCSTYARYASARQSLVVGIMHRKSSRPEGHGELIGLKNTLFNCDIRLRDMDVFGRGRCLMFRRPNRKLIIDKILLLFLAIATFGIFVVCIVVHSFTGNAAGGCGSQSQAQKAPRP